MSSMSLSALTVQAAEAHEGGVNHWLIGGVTLFLLMAMIGALMMFGAGREHS